MAPGISPGWIRAGLLAYGVLVALFGINTLSQQIPDAATMMDARSHPIQASIDELDRGGPPLWATGAANCRAGVGCAIAPADDQGIFLILPLAGHLLHIRDPLLLVKWFAILLTAVILVSYPLAFYEIFGSLIVAVAAPFVILTKMSFVENTEVYFAVAWAVLLGLPALFALHGRTSRTARVLLVLLVISAALASTIRLHAGLPIFIGAIVSTWLTRESTKKWIVLLVVLAAAYFPVVDIPYDVARYRDAVTGVPSTDVIETQHGIWHSIYIGLGYLPNPYGITFSDSSGDIAAHRVNPNIEFGTREYQDVMRGIVLDLVRQDPLFIIKNIAAKVGASALAAVVLLGPLGVLLAPMLLFGMRRRTMRKLMLIALPSALITFAIPVFYVPLPQYEVGWLGTIGVMWMLAASWSITEAVGGAKYAFEHEELARGRVRAFVVEARLMLRRPAYLASAVAVITLALVLSISLYRNAAYARLVDFYDHHGPDPVPIGDLKGETLASWSFDVGPNGWTPFKGVRTTSAADGLTVTTNEEPLEYQFASPVFSLTPGRYVASISGRVLAGGLNVGVLDASADHWVHTEYYWFGQQLDGARMIAVFDLSATTDVRVILSNWTPDRSSSTWLLRDATVLRLKAATN